MLPGFSLFKGPFFGTIFLLTPFKSLFPKERPIIGSLGGPAPGLVALKELEPLRVPTLFSLPTRAVPKVALVVFERPF